MSARAFVALAAAVSIALVGAYAALGGGSYEPQEVADPCESSFSIPAFTLDAAAQELGLGLLDAAACELDVTREQLALALVSDDARARLERQLERAGTDDGIVARLFESAARAFDQPEDP
jgi:hypothetical protein